ncbi:MAG: FAD-dependent oxidoreductase [Desulfobacteraceae bacterium]|nr:FAD-dependent oxidoreductase [Desulfobacteraceae bacterium]MDH3722260.1 FAD-dependent oxidoreductase [Desulfobacteraceae bacterium]MDH3836614.1 FAD-dependent oxidoreductase [Desulfobacteraceae bacterium]MDH3872691.1 FAD-dependent oxidoreductase [Desulfobacteraceae bacterium]MDH3956827.1 FAD-dependent oxidoreductase [Desulfobacteraceae bacterium]
MTIEPKHAEKISLFISRSNISTEINKTGTWRFVRPKYHEKTAPCSAACPAGEDIARIEMLSNQGRYQDALETILLENPFPSVCGRVCFHPCETVCNRAGFDDPVAIHALERFIGDTAIRDDLTLKLKKLPENGKTVCIVGAGPSGLAAGYFLSKLGYSCDIYEARSEPGGILRWGIPRYRLPDDIVFSEIERIKKTGVKIICNTPVTQNFLQNVKDRYHALFIGCGHGRSLKMNIPGETKTFDGLEFLNLLRKRKALPSNETVAVIGGGNTAIDCARSLVRLGATTTLVYRRRKQDMPAFKNEVEMADKEGVRIMELYSPLEINEDDGEYVLSLQKMKTSGMETDSGRARVIPDSQTTQHLRVQKIIVAIGAEPSVPWQFPSHKNTEALYLTHCTFTASEPPLLFGGDLTNTIKSVTDAVASGKQAAMALDIFFKQGRHAITDRLNSCLVGNGPALSMECYMGGKRLTRNPHIVSNNDINLDYFSQTPRVEPESLAIKKRMNSFDEIEATFTIEQAMEETRRCFNCGICNACDNCRIFCPEIAVILQDAKRQINLDYCKGCGICVFECPRSAMDLEEEL